MSFIRTIQNVAQKEELSCTEVRIKGDVYEESIIDANTFRIEGTTHAGSTQFAKYATIYSHKGTLRCHEAKITLLEEGEVHATKVSIDTAISGFIYAQDVQIKHLTGSVTVYASNTINIEHISGKDNKLFINYKEVPILTSKVELIQDDIKELTISLYKARRDNSTLEKEIESELIHLEQEIQKIQNSVKTARISIQDPIKTKNTICFAVTDSDTLTYETKEGKYSSFYLCFEADKVTLKPTTQTIQLSS